MKAKVFTWFKSDVKSSTPMWSEGVKRLKGYVIRVCLRTKRATEAP